MATLFSLYTPHSTSRLPFPSPYPPHKPFLCCPLPRRNLTLQPLALPSSPRESTDIELLGKPSPIPVPPEPDEPEDTPKPLEPEEALAPFLKFFRPEEDPAVEDPQLSEGAKKVAVEYYDPKPGDLVVGVVVSGNEHRMDVNVGADALGTMLTKEALPLHEGNGAAEPRDLTVDVEEIAVRGRAGIVKDENGLGEPPPPGRPVMEVGTVLFAEVLGRTLSGRPLLSTRRMFRRVAWHRVRQLKQLNEPFEVTITHWNTGGLVTRVEGLRAFLPKAELMRKINNFTDLKENVGRRILVCISKIDEADNDLVISEKEAWDMLYLQEGTLLDGTIGKVFPFGAQVRIGETNRSGLLHISNITRSRVDSVSDVLKVNEKVKVLVIKSVFPGKISLSIAHLESEPGLFLSNREKVFSEAEERARLYRSKLPAISARRKFDPPTGALLFDNESKLYANWKWFKFERDNERPPSDDKDYQSS